MTPLDPSARERWQAVLVQGQWSAMRAMLAEPPLPADAALGDTPMLHRALAIAHDVREYQGAAAAAGHLTAFEGLLQAGLDPNVSDAYGASPLMLAADYRLLPWARRLLEAGGRAEYQAPRGSTALHGAAQQGSLALTRLLIAHGAPLDAQDVEGRTALHCAAHGNHRPLLSAFYHAGARWDVRNAKGQTPIDVLATFDRNLAQWWAHRPGHDALLRALETEPEFVAPPPRVRLRL